MYSRFCDGRFEYITPLSKEGDKYLVNEFKKKNLVTLHFENTMVVFDATGFIKAWDNFGGDAI